MPSRLLKYCAIKHLVPKEGVGKNEIENISIVRVKNRKRFLELRQKDAIFFYPLNKLKKVLYTVYIFVLLFSLPAFVGLSAKSNNPLMIAIALVIWQYLIRNDIPWPLYAITEWEKKFKRKYF